MHVTTYKLVSCFVYSRAYSSSIILLGPQSLTKSASTQTVQEPEKYLMLPFYPPLHVLCQFAAEDQIANLLHTVVTKGSKMQLTFSYFIYEDTGNWSTPDFNEVVKKGSQWDLRWQLKHLMFYRNNAIYCSCVFQLIDVQLFSTRLQHIKDRADFLAHKGYLNNPTRGQQERDFVRLLKEMIDDEYALLYTKQLTM